MSAEFLHRHCTNDSQFDVQLGEDIGERRADGAHVRFLQQLMFAPEAKLQRGLSLQSLQELRHWTRPLPVKLIGLLVRQRVLTHNCAYCMGMVMGLLKHS